ncbi:hypothetical protein CC2G_005721 [Coprinopsis cinerea AmutBmut pab1-1]|nr:hypothetical protein CC2G_005721 [Coprinopsis cinerea AmutBmut pab1-1]
MTSEHSSRSMGPSSITLPPPPVFSSFSLQGCTPDKSPSPQQFHTAPSSPLSPPVQWYTPPTTPRDESVPSEHKSLPPQPVELLPPSASVRVSQSPLRHQDSAPAAPTHPPDIQTDDAFPSAIVDLAADLPFGEESLNTLEKIYLYSRSESSVHRVFIAHQLPTFLDQVAPQEAIEYVLPLIGLLAVDEDEDVKEALATELVPVIWWFFSNCQIIPDDSDSMQTFASTSTTATISVQVFTPILAALLLSSNPLIVGSARFAVVDLLTRMRRADDRESGVATPDLPQPADHGNPGYASSNIDLSDDDEATFKVGMFKHDERALFRHEILHSVVIGMGRLGLDVDPDTQPSDPVNRAREDAGADTNRNQHLRVSTPQEERPQSPLRTSVNPYFPATPSESSEDASRQPPTRPLSPPTSPKATSPKSWNHFTGPSPPSPPPIPTPSLDPEQEQPEGEENDEEQAAIGQLSSMSLMAAVTATGLMAEDVQRAFVKEVERVGRDSGHFYVRREASLALGALAKVVPEELVASALLPLFDTLRWDSDWRVRHSALFALPAILPRLSPNQRRTVALETIMALSKDVYGAVRSSVLESLGEVLYTFHNDPGGPPDQLLQMFLGRKEDVDVRQGKTTLYPWMVNQQQEDATESFYTDPERPLICAFNFPAVALTLGGPRWPELREVYLDLSKNPNGKVRKTLAASLGEMAKIVGRDAAQKDLLPVWWSSVRFEDEEVRSKAIEALATFLPILSVEERVKVIDGVLVVWKENIFRGWREREAILGLVETFLELGGTDSFCTVKCLLVKGLEDSVSSVREAAISRLPRIWHAFTPSPVVAQTLRHDLDAFATSPSYKRRITYVGCLHACALHIDAGFPPPVDANVILKMLEPLTEDPVVDVRIGAARILNLLYVKDHDSSQSPVLTRLSERMSSDTSQEVRSYLPEVGLPSHQEASPSSMSTSSTGLHRKRHPPPSTFSRPPPVRQWQPAQSEVSSLSSPNVSSSIQRENPGPGIQPSFGERDGQEASTEHREMRNGPVEISLAQTWVDSNPTTFMSVQS